MKHPFDLHPVRARPRHRRRRGGDNAATILLACLLGSAAWVMLPKLDTQPLPAPGAAATALASFGLCHSGGGRDCVVDGDTFWLNGTKIRIADIDTPETHPARCRREAELGEAATRRLRELLSGGAIELQAIDRDSDRYGRKLRIVSVDGLGVGDTLIAEGLARPYAGRGRAGWCD